MTPLPNITAFEAAIHKYATTDDQHSRQIGDTFNSLLYQETAKEGIFQELSLLAICPGTHPIEQGYLLMLKGIMPRPSFISIESSES
ncbi:hypothetical protein ASPCADRAFT_3943 [Aspergillus carbonarius ITEM 5010]|uniref:Uncharacterized protein n=1 Tax=Aspergillus carbonarius (strain ITEM 5010) TaxID=602072 RepID=A0A1R3RS83_ASPC5|nr:hypothetical protein ASPCADRAFT_3943 [Aspergillus carbonarius ITEM 5010]